MDADSGPERRGRPDGSRSARRGARTLAGAVTAVALLAGCGAQEPGAGTPTFHGSPGPSDHTSPDPAATPDQQPPTAGAAPQDPAAEPGPALPAGPALPPATSTPQDVLTGLATPWGLAFLPGGSALITLRDPAQVLLLTGSGVQTLTGPGADDLAATTEEGGEGGLLGVAVSPDAGQDGLVYLYRTTAEGNEVVRAVLDAAAGTLGELEPVLSGIPAAANHNGGRIAFGPDGHLYVATGDAGRPGIAQDPDSLGGKILRVTPDGDPAPGNPDPASPVWSLGHRNVQGLAWDDESILYASELGQNAQDELNIIVPGENYGWPQVEGRADVEGFTDPVLTWSPEEASPSGIATVRGDVHVAALRGARLWSVAFAEGEAPHATAHLEGDLGRLRDVVAGPDGALWILTQNTDGRGRPRPGDDRLVRVAPPPTR